MTIAITRARVCEALSKSDCFVPDFTTRKKTTLSWNKVYISIQGNELRFVELNFLQRMIRYLAGCMWYSDTIFTDKTTLEKVKEYVRGIKHDPIAMNLLPKAQTTSDFICLRYMLGNCSEQTGFSEGFLSEAIALARQNPENKMWMNITKILDTTNRALLHEILGLTEEEYLPSRQIEVPDEIKYAFDEGIEKASGALKDIGFPQTLASYLKALGALEKINKDLDKLPEVLRPFLTEDCGKQMVEDLNHSLILIQAHPSMIKAYLEDEKQIVSRLCYHAGLDSRALRNQIKDKVENYRAAVMKELDAHYQVVEPPQSDSFSASCDRYQKLTKMTWREQIAGELVKDAESQVLAKARIKEKGWTLDQYFQSIKDPQSPVGLPELKILSKITGRPVLVVNLKTKMLVGDNFEWIHGINLDLDQKPIILNENKKGIWGAVELIQSTGTLL
jgi:hypothetical protein